MTSSSKSNIKTIFCKDCHVSLGVICWNGLQETNDIRCSKCALKEFDL